MDFPSRSLVRSVACPNCRAAAGELCFTRYKFLPKDQKAKAKRTTYRRLSNHMERVELYLTSIGHTRQEVGLA